MAIIISGNGIDMGNNPVSNVNIQNDVDVVDKEYVDNRSALPIGTILNGYTIFDNCIVAFGGEFNRADYPKLWAYLQANPSLVKTQTQWQTEATANGGICGYFSDGNGTTTFIVPNLNKAFLRPDSRTVGSFEQQQVSTHSHDGIVTTNTSAYLARISGGTRNTWIGVTGAGPGTEDSVMKTINSGVGIGTDNRPKNIAVLPLIVAK